MFALAQGKDCSWFSGGAYFRLPNTQTEFLNKLQKIICVCVTWGNKDNLVSTYLHSMNTWCIMFLKLDVL